MLVRHIVGLGPRGRGSGLLLAEDRGYNKTGFVFKMVAKPAAVLHNHQVGQVGYKEHSGETDSSTQWHESHMRDCKDEQHSPPPGPLVIPHGGDIQSIGTDH